MNSPLLYVITCSARGWTEYGKQHGRGLDGCRAVNMHGRTPLQVGVAFAIKLFDSRHLARRKVPT